MKITIDIDCTPEEARTFLGLPDMQPFHDTILKEMEKRLTHGIQAEDMEALMKLWMPLAGTGWEKMQNMFWNAATSGKSDEGGQKSK